MLIAHTSGNQITGGFLWQLHGYGQTAVMTFFVLSGYVIGFVAFNKEKTLKEYSISRVSRLYSVIIPALLLTLICNEVGALMIDREQQGPWDFDRIPEYGRYIVTLFNFQDVWSIGYIPPNNGAFWSISFELFYYLFFAVLLYVRGQKKYAILAALFLVSGPTIIILFPLWLLGLLAYWIHREFQRPQNKYSALFIFLASLFAIICSPIYREYFDYALPMVTRDSLIGDYLDGIFIFINILAAKFMLNIFSFAFFTIERPVRYVANLTFALYLFHMPLVRLFAKISPFSEAPGSAANIAFVYITTLLVVVLIGTPAEKSKRKLKERLKALF